jgi:macrodomain Ter protein organizer (MatP/YcbG family)
MTELHLGERVKRVIERSKDTVKEAAVKLKESEPNLYKKFKMADLSTEFIRRVSITYRVPFSSFFADNQLNMSASTGGINQVGEKNFSQYNNQDTQILSERLNSCEREKQLLLEQIDLYKKLLKL